jgi:hypothetical protein
MSTITREQFIKLISAGGASFLGLDSLASAADLLKGPLVPWSRLKFIGEGSNQEDWHVHPQGDLNLLDSIRGQTSVNIDKKWNVADITKLDSMTQFPFLFMHGEIAPVFDDNSKNNLREYLMRGGFLFAEDCVNGYGHHGGNRNNDYFFQAVVQQLPSILPGSKLEKLPPDHPVFHCYHHFDPNDKNIINGMPHMQGNPHGLHAVSLDGRIVALVSPSDLHCGWVNGDAWFYPGATRDALQMGINIYLYAMTQNA